MKTVVGLFDSTSEAQGMLEELMHMGFQPDDISVVTNVASQERVEGGPFHLAAMNLADVGKVATGGPLREALRRAPAGSLALRGALERSGFPADLADRYAAGVERGGTLESLVVPDSEADRVIAAMKRRSSPAEKPEKPAVEREEVREEPAAPGPTPATAQTTQTGAVRETREAVRDDESREVAREGGAGAETVASRGLERDEEWRIPVVREELKVGKRSVERGGIRVTVRAVERPVSEQIRLRESHVEVERRPVDRPLTADAPTFRDQTIEVPEQAEETVVSKEARVVEEVVVHKHVVDRVETVRDSVRSTEVDFGHRREGAND